MKHIYAILSAMIVSLSSLAAEFSYSFDNTPVAEALTEIAKDHPGLDINFIYKELDLYTTSARILTDSPVDAIRRTVGRNPITVIVRGGAVYVEAMQHGRFCYSGRAVDAGGDAVVGATVMLLEPVDSTVVTYGTTGTDGRFVIPCDRRDVIAKFTCVGYRPTYRDCPGFSLGTVVMDALPIQLDVVNVEADNAEMYSDRTVYIPTARQKNASQSGVDLLDHMSLPQLRTVGGKVETAGGKPVALFIDYLPASETDLRSMKMTDVRRVEYYDYPSDPRLQGNAHVINFIMAQYEYGGYVKGFGFSNLICFTEELHANVRFQYKKMTYDLASYGFNLDQKHFGQERTETYRLPQPDGSVREFDRFSNTTWSKEVRRQGGVAFKATYNSDKVQASTLLQGNIHDMPHSDRRGDVRYSTPDYRSSEYESTFDNLSKVLTYNGYYFFVLPKNNTLTFTPSYTYSHTGQRSSYTEYGYKPVFNRATDNTNQFKANLKFNHDFGRYGSLLGFVRGSYEYNRTQYSGSSVSLDRAKSSRIGVGATYNVTVGNFYGMTGFGWDWDRLQFGDMTDTPSSPWVDLSLQYAFSKKHSASTTFHYSTWQPSPNFKSDNVIASTPLMSYTGNPNLVSSKSYDIGLNYTWIPDNNYSFDAFGWAWIVGDRYVYDYEATPTGILRTIKQPLGSFVQGRYGVSATGRFFDRNLVLTAQIAQRLNYNGKPYNVDHARFSWYGRAAYYFDKWFCSLTYVSGGGVPDGYMNGIWINYRSDWYLTLGWSDSRWNLRANIININRWDWRSDTETMHSTYYDSRTVKLANSNHALIQLSVTYTFGFGKKVATTDEPGASGTASSGILK